MSALLYFKAIDFFRKYVIYIIVALLIIASLFIIPNISAISEKFGIETRASLKAKVAEQNKTIELAIDVNKQNTDTIVREKVSSDIVEKVLVNKNKKEIVLSKIITDIKKKRKHTIDKLVKSERVDNIVKVSPTGENVVNYTDEQVIKIAETNIDAIWTAYETVQNQGVIKND
jgi:hypothetical protein